MNIHTRSRCVQVDEQNGFYEIRGQVLDWNEITACPNNRYIVKYHEPLIGWGIYTACYILEYVDGYQDFYFVEE